MKTCLILLCLFASQGFTMSEDYRSGAVFSSEQTINLGDPNSVGDPLLQHNQDHSGIASTNDTVLAEQGAAKLQNSEFKDVVRDANSAVVNGREEHQINLENGFFKQSLLVQQDPFKLTGGREMQQRSLVTKETQESCDEGVSFELDVIKQLVYVPPPRTILNTEITINYPEYLRKVGRRNDEIAFMTIYDTNKQINLQRFKQYGCPHFQPVDALSGKRYTIDCNRIQNFFLVSVPKGADGVPARTVITDCYGDVWNVVNLIRISYKHDTYQSEGVNRDQWEVLNPDNEALVEKHHCQEIRRRCLDSGAKHFDELVVNRPCWKEQITYLCESDPLEGCKHLKAKNCTLASSECVDKHGELCLKWRHHYICKLEQEVVSTGVEGGDVFCLDGNCYTPQNEQNTDMNNAVAHLAIFSQMQKDMVVDPPRVFTGECLGCSKHMASFLNCCSSMKGWGRSAGFSDCKPEEEKLARQRAAGLCHFVGTYCAEKFPLGGCMRKKSTFCCFQSKLARIFHEGGRGQIGMSWGTAENPDCRAFTVEELQRIDFSKINLSEIFADLFRDIGSKIQKMVPRQMKDQMPVLQKDIDQLKARNQQQWKEDGVQKTVF